MPTKLKQLVITKVDLCSRGADPDADILIFKSRDAELPHSSTPAEEDTPVAKPNKIDITKAKPEEIAAYVTDLEKSLADTEAELATAKKPAPKEPEPKTDEEMMKSLPEPVRKAFEAVQAAAKAAEARAVAAEAVAKSADEKVAKAQSEAELVTIKKTVETQMPKIPGTVDEIAKMLQQAKATLTADSYTVLEKALKAGSEAIAKAEQEIGSTGATVEGGAWEEICKRADAMVSKGEFKTRPEAITKVAETDPALYARYKEEQKARR